VLCGLAEGRARANVPTLKAWLDEYAQGRGDVKPRTLAIFGDVKRNLLAYFAPDRLLDSITAGDVDGFAVHLRTSEKLADSTARRRMGIAKQFFRAAVRRRLLAENPFDGQAVSARANPKRMAFVSRADTAAILKALPDAKWRLVFALARYGGLRCPSEIAGLKWSDISWGPRGERFTVHAVKTEHYADAGIRVVPIFPELAPLFREAFEAAEPGAVYCCPQYPGNFCGQMYRKMVLQAMTRAGVKPWPKLFQNCRASRETELAESYPVQVVCSWIGNSPAVAAKHYLQTTEEHYARATANVAQNVAQQVLKMPRNTVNDKSPEAVLQAATSDCAPMQINMVRSRGVEPPIAVKRTGT
jgi:integrase